MADFKIDGRMKVKKLKELFATEFGGTLRVYNGKKLAEDDATLASIRSNEGAKGGEFTCRASRTVGKFEQEIWDVFGIKVQVATCDDHVLVLDGITLSKVKDIPKYASKESMEEFLSYKRKGKENTSIESSELKKFKMKITTKGASAIEMANLDTDEFDIDELTMDDVWDLDTDYLAECALGDEWEGRFSLEVYGENNELVYQNDDFTNFNFIVSIMDYDDMLENENINQSEELINIIKSKIEQRIKEDKEKRVNSVGINENGEKKAVSYVGVHEIKWCTCEYYIEDTEFDPQKLIFVANPLLEAVNFDYNTDENHVFYGQDFLDVIRDEDGGGLYSEEYGCTGYVVERSIDRFYTYEELRELEED